MNMNASDLLAVPLLDRPAPDMGTLNRIVTKNLQIDYISHNLDCEVRERIGGELKLPIICSPCLSDQLWCSIL
jgi:hypothetical protein